MIRLRPATKKDARSIRALIYLVGINPMSLNWQRFILAVDDQDRLVGCGQVKQHADGSRELASIAVQKAWRGQGIASMMIRYLVDQAAPDVNHPLYLTCRAQLGPFYQRFGFRPIGFSAMPPYFLRIARLVAVFQRLWKRREGLLVMIHTG